MHSYVTRITIEYKCKDLIFESKIFLYEIYCMCENVIYM